MPTKELKSTITAADEAHLKAWISAIVPGLKSRWAKYLADLPPHQSPPELGDWLALLHAAIASPWKIPRYLSQLLGAPKSSAELQNGWAMLTGLFQLTFQAAQAEASQLDAVAWQSLTKIQSQIFKAAAHKTLVLENRPDTDMLNRRALYLQTVIDLNRKIVNGSDPTQVLDDVVALIQQNFDYEYVNLFLLNQVRHKLELQNAAWKHRPFKPEDFVSRKVGVEGLVGQVAATCQVLLVYEVSQNGYFVTHPY
jgi:hypothetical protein